MKVKYDAYSKEVDPLSEESVELINKTIKAGDVLVKNNDDSKSYYLVYGVSFCYINGLAFVVSFDSLDDDHDLKSGRDIFSNAELLNAINHKGELWFPRDEYEIEIVKK